LLCSRPIGSNSLIDKANTRSALVESSRSVTDGLTRLTTDASYAGVKILKADGTDAGAAVGVALLVRVYNPALGQNLCELIGRASQTTDATGQPLYALANDNAGTYIAMWIYSLNNAGICDTTKFNSLPLVPEPSDRSGRQGYELSAGDEYSPGRSDRRDPLRPNSTTIAASTGSTAEARTLPLK